MIHFGKHFSYCAFLLPSFALAASGGTITPECLTLSGPPPQIPGMHTLKQVSEELISTISPTSRTCSSVTYRFPEKNLLPGESLQFDVPEELRERGVTFMILGHRQPTEKEKGDWDPAPGLSSVQVFGTFGDQSKPSWRYWAGSASGDLGAKYAERRSRIDPEMENFYDWNQIGHRGVEGGSKSTQPLKPRAIRVVSTGKSPVLVSELTLKVNPLPADEFATGIFTHGTEFPKPGSTQGPKFGGGQILRGRFPGAVALGAQLAPHHVPLPSGWKFQKDELRIPLPPGKKLASVEIACGDSHPDEETNSDGGWGIQGWGKLSVEIQRKDGSRETLISHENVPPEGLLLASPVDCDRKSQTGEEVVIRSSGDTVYLMGVRLGLR